MNEATQKTMFSSQSNEWETPKSFYDRLDKVFGFTLDPCCTEQTAKCATYYTEADDGLSKDWGGHTVFMNPPYGRDIKDWIRKAHEEGKKDGTVVVALIPSRTDTRYWHEYCMRAKSIMFVKGRLKFGGSKNAAPFPSAVVVFDGSRNPSNVIQRLESWGYPNIWTIDANDVADKKENKISIRQITGI